MATVTVNGRRQAVVAPGVAYGINLSTNLLRLWSGQDLVLQAEDAPNLVELVVGDVQGLRVDNAGPTFPAGLEFADLGADVANLTTLQLGGGSKAITRSLATSYPAFLGFDNNGAPAAAWTYTRQVGTIRKIGHSVFALVSIAWDTFDVGGAGAHSDNELRAYFYTGSDYLPRASGSLELVALRFGGITLPTAAPGPYGSFPNNWANTSLQGWLEPSIGNTTGLSSNQWELEDGLVLNPAGGFIEFAATWVAQGGTP